MRAFVLRLGAVLAVALAVWPEAAAARGLYFRRRVDVVVYRRPAIAVVRVVPLVPLLVPAVRVVPVVRVGYRRRYW